MTANEQRSATMKRIWKNPFYRLKMRKHLKRLHLSGENHPSYKKIKLSGKLLKLFPNYENH